MRGVSLPMGDYVVPDENGKVVVTVAHSWWVIVTLQY